MFDSTTIPVLEQVLSFAQARHGVLAGNIANVNTPGYRVADLSPERFAERLKEAIDARRDSGSPGLAPSGSYESLGAVTDSVKGILYHDDSDVNLELQIAELVKNQGQHNLALTILTSQFRLLEAAISERLV